MWIIAKYKQNEFKILQDEFFKVLGNNLKFYIPKIKYEKIVNNKIRIVQKSILEDYLICYHPEFKFSQTLQKLKYTKGLNFFLNGFKENQNQIQNFVNNCKKYENKDGFITKEFFNDINSTKCKFISGPFTEMIFHILSRQKNSLKILIGNIKTTISKNSLYLYRPI
tara:strand:- start:760 stop:1260 length:501 start_codon:yes stop_codon:yes gene_type:complete